MEINESRLVNHQPRAGNSVGLTPQHGGQCLSSSDKRVAASHSVQLIEAEEMADYDNSVDWLSFLPDGHVVDCVIGHGAILGGQMQVIKCHCNCKWIQVVHTAPEELGMFKSYTDGISTERREKAPGWGKTL